MIIKILTKRDFTLKADVSLWTGAYTWSRCWMKEPLGGAIVPGSAQGL